MGKFEIFKNVVDTLTIVTILAMTNSTTIFYLFIIFIFMQSGSPQLIKSQLVKSLANTPLASP